MTVANTFVDSFEDAARLVFREAAAEGMKPEVATLFGSGLDRGGLRQEMERVVASAIKARYGKGAWWEIEEWWLVPVPRPRYEARALPCLVVESKVHGVAAVEVVPERSRRRGYITVVQPLAKPQTTLLPLHFLRALLDGDLDRYRKVGKDGLWTSWEVVGLKQPLRLHDSLVEGLTQTFKVKPVPRWLEDFGPHGRAVMPPVCGVLLGLMYRDISASLPPEQQPCNLEELLPMVTSLGYSTTRAKRWVKQAEPEFRPGMSKEEALRIILKYIDKEI
jgi:hypothetical protein